VFEWWAEKPRSREKGCTGLAGGRKSCEEVEFNAEKTRVRSVGEEEEVAL